jgi:hypothetical protein
MKSILTILLVLSTLTGLAQIKATTDDGRAVLLMRDGTWKFDTDKKQEVTYECDALTKKSGDSSGSSSPLIIEGQSGKRLALTLVKGTDGNINLIINTDGAGDCTKKGSAITIIYRDSTSDKIANDADENCNKRLNLALGKATRDNAMLNKLKNKEIASVSAYTKEGNISVTFDSEQSKVFLNTLWCLAAR